LTSRPADVLVGVDVGGTKIAGGVVDPVTGAVRHQTTVPTALAGGSAEVLHGTVELVRRLAACSEVDGARVVGVGVGVPELVAPDGTITSAHLLPWNADGVRAALAAGSLGRESLAGTVWVDSDVRCAALAEARFGAGRPYDPFVYVTIGTGLAFSLVQGGVPYAGARGHAHLLLAPGAEEWRAGAVVPGDVSSDDTAGDGEQPPLLETIAAGPALVKAFRDAGGDCADDAREVLAAAADGDPKAAAAVQSAGAAAGAGIAVLVNAFDPEAVVVGGGLGLAGGAYWSAALAQARRLTWAPLSRGLPVVPAGLGVDAGVVGAALAADRRR
jgi:glucokinase